MKKITLYTLNKCSHGIASARMMTNPEPTKETVKVFTGRPTPNQIAVALDIPPSEQELYAHGLRTLANGGHMTHGAGHTYYELIGEEYQQATAPLPEVSAGAWKEAYLAEKLKALDYIAQLEKLRVNWNEFSEEIARLYNKAHGIQIELYEGYVKSDKSNPEELVETYKPLDQDRDRFQMLIQYLNPEYVVQR